MVIEGELFDADTCEKSSVCWNVDLQTGEGTCLEFCHGIPRNPFCPQGFVCHIPSDGLLNVCLPWCDPLAQDCAGDELCLPYGNSWGCVLDASGEEGQYGDPCEYANTCDPGLICLNPEYVPDCQASGCCSPFCDTSAPNTCPTEGQVCIPWYEEGMAPPGLEHVGVCGVPQP